MMRVLVLAVLLATAVARPGSPYLKPMMGWNTWCTQNSCGVDWCTSDEVLNVAQSIKSSGMQAAGYEYINLDDCWGIRDLETHEIKGDPARFPEGMAAFIEKIHALGFKFGLYTDIGESACHFPFTGSFPYYEKDAATFKDWQVDFIKFDGCNLPSGYDAETLTCNMSNVLNQTGRHFWFNFHCWHNGACAECGDSFRVGPDHHDNWASTSGVIDLLAKNREPFWGQNPTRGWPDPDFFYTGGEGCGPHSAPGVRCPGQTEDEYISEFTIWAIAGGHLVLASDPRNMSDFQRRVILNKEILDVFNDITGFGDIVMKPQNASLQNAVLPLPQAQCNVSLIQQISSDACVSGQTFGCYNENLTMWTDGGCRGLFECDGVKGVSCNEDGDGRHECPCVAPLTPYQVWFRPLGNGDMAVAVHNPAYVTGNITVKFSDAPLRNWTSSTTLSVRDLWQHADLGVQKGFMQVSTPSHGARMFRLSANRIELE